MATIGKPVLIPTSDEETGKDKLKKEKMKNAQVQKADQNSPQKGSVHHSLPLHRGMRMCCCCRCMR